MQTFRKTRRAVLDRSFKAAAAVVTAIALATGAAEPADADVVERFASDPLVGGGPNPFFAEGDASARFAYLPGEPSHFPGDREGSLRVLYDTTLPGARISTPLGRVLTLDDDFSFGAILTIRSEGFHADPNGFSQIAFGLWNAATTGMNRTSFPSDSFDLVEFDYFPNVTAYGGPFLAPTVFGGNVGGNAFFNFAFQSSEVALPHDTPLLVQARYGAAARRLDLTVIRHLFGVFFESVPGATVAVDLSRLDPTFQVDVAGIAAYFEGYASLRAEVDYDLLYVGDLPRPFGIGRRILPAPPPTEPQSQRTTDARM
ncbi:MAG: hypothetical protein HY510_05465 [Acidobacteria bacterium]|nr:hypothetical protein [Acidobacteriota bacterium]